MFSFSDVFRQRDFSRVPGTREFHGWERSLGFNHLSFFRISMQLLYTYALIHLIDMMQLNCVFLWGFQLHWMQKNLIVSACWARQPWRVWLKLLGLMAFESDWYPLDTPRHCRWVFELKSLVCTSLTGFGWFCCSSMGIGSVLTQLTVGLGDH